MAAIIGNRNITLGVLGGTLITACAGFGGNVFGCSPYDAATTRYLKATYPQYWQAIRNFGWDNPQLVPWINEDNDLIVSLVGVGKERWLVGDTKAYINTGIYPNTDTSFDITMQPTDTSNNYCGVLSGSSRGNDAGLELYYWDSTWSIVSNSSFGTGVRVVVGRNYRIQRIGTNWKIYENGVQVGVGTRNKVSYTSNSPICLFLLNRNNAKSYNSKCKISECYLLDDTMEQPLQHFVPCKNPNGSDYGMLDLVNLKWYGNANTSGAFTIEMTDTPT